MILSIDRLKKVAKPAVWKKEAIKKLRRSNNNGSEAKNLDWSLDIFMK